MAGAAASAWAEAFTALDLDAAEQLLQLSQSSASSGGFSSSLRSVNAPPAPAPGGVIQGGCVDWEEDEEHKVPRSQSRVKHYRLITEIYAATEEIGGRSGSSRKNKKE